VIDYEEALMRKLVGGGLAAIVLLWTAHQTAGPVGAQLDPTYEQLTPTISYNSHQDRQDFLLAWIEDRGGGPDIYGKLLFQNGLPKGGADRGGFQLVRDAGYNRGTPQPKPRSAPDVVYSPDREEFLLVFSQMAEELDGWDVYGVRLSASGYSKGDPRLIAGGPGDQQHPDVALIGEDGDYIVVFDDNTRDIDEVWGVRVRANGIPNGSPFPLQQDAANASDPTTNGSLVAWVDDRNGDTDIFAVRINPNGLKDGTDYRLAYTDDNDTNPNFGSGQLVWNVFDAATGLDIQGAQVYDNGLVRGGQQGILVPAADQGWPSTANGGLVVFSDNRTGEYDLYGVRVANGRSRGREFPLVRDIAYP
jgi:hypothetical protein